MTAKINLSRATQFLLSAVLHAQHACKRTREMVVHAMADEMRKIKTELDAEDAPPAESLPGKTGPTALASVASYQPLNKAHS